MPSLQFRICTQTLRRNPTMWSAGLGAQLRDCDAACRLCMHYIHIDDRNRLQTAYPCTRALNRKEGFVHCRLRCTHMRAQSSRHLHCSQLQERDAPAAQAPDTCSTHSNERFSRWLSYSSASAHRWSVSRLCRQRSACAIARWPVQLDNTPICARGELLEHTTSRAKHVRQQC